MKEIITWLIQVEKLAGDFYHKAYEYFNHDASLRKFLGHAAEDEAWHFHVMGSALNNIDSFGLPNAIISLDQETRERIVAPFHEGLKKLESGQLTKEALIDCVAKSEFSEWNDVFLFVLNTLKSHAREFSYVATALQHHLRFTQHFLESTAYGEQKVKEIKQLDTVFDENILIVEDDPAVAEMLKVVLSAEGNVDIAQNGEEGLNRIQSKYYRLVVSDIDMPVMDGIDFYKKAVALIPDLTKRVLFFTGAMTQTHDRFFKEHRLHTLVKPAPIRQLLKTAVKIMHGFSE
ncbi:MAG: response regulator [Desulfobacterales bacterium]|nr:response regulator [Desulfobacterales bacterium]